MSELLCIYHPLLLHMITVIVTVFVEISEIHKYQLINSYDDIHVQVYTASGVVNHPDLSSLDTL